jgi:hypothetical protein
VTYLGDKDWNIPPSIGELGDDQRRAYELVQEHLKRQIANEPTRPLRLLLSGEGGTGKSRVIQMITEMFELNKVSHWLKKTAYTGVAASLIDGKTTHTIASIQRGRKLSSESKAKLAEKWKHTRYLIIDEYSMISKSHFAAMSLNIGIAKTQAGASHNDSSFGGISVIICGDHHQFPPVACSPREALYVPVNGEYDNDRLKLGRSIFEEFTDIVILRQQRRVTDDVWRSFLKRLRIGQVSMKDIDMLKSLTLTNPACQLPDFTKHPWNTTTLITSRHEVRRQWNARAIQLHAHSERAQVYLCNPEDRVGKSKRLLTLSERLGVFEHFSLTKGSSKDKSIDTEPLELFIGMRVMITMNVETDLDVTNGARGTVVDIILHCDEPVHDEASPVIVLAHLPSCILIRLDRTRMTPLFGLEAGVVPLTPEKAQFKVFDRKTKSKRTIDRYYFPITAAYAITDYRSQGQTIPSVIVDLAQPPTGGGLNLFNLYVALSRSSGRSTIRILRPFKEELFSASHRSDLMDEDDRLERMDQQCRERYLSLLKFMSWM